MLWINERIHYFGNKFYRLESFFFLFFFCGGSLSCNLTINLLDFMVFMVSLYDRICYTTIAGPLNLSAFQPKE